MNKAIFAVMICLVTAALVGGFMVVGGPEQARAEIRDRDRAGLMYRYRTYLLCNGQKAQSLPQRLNDGAYCPGIAAEHIAFGEGEEAVVESISYIRESDAAFRLCSRFESSGYRIERVLHPFPLIAAREDGRYCLEGSNGFSG